MWQWKDREKVVKTSVAPKRKKKENVRVEKSQKRWNGEQLFIGGGVYIKKVNEFGYLFLLEMGDGYWQVPHLNLTTFSSLSPSFSKFLCLSRHHSPTIPPLPLLLLLLLLFFLGFSFFIKFLPIHPCSLPPTNHEPHVWVQGSG